MENDTTNSRELKAGTTLAGGKYVIESVLGGGGFGITYKAHHSKLNQSFAIKEFFINGYSMRDSQRLTVHSQGMNEKTYDKYHKKFIEEAQTLAKLDHPNIVKVMDVFDENGTSYIVMPFLQGQTIQSLVEKNGALPYEIGVNYMAQICEALDYIHSRDILHRDIKPDNIIITPENKAILIDFGSAREFAHDEIQNHTIIFTRGYACPEQYTKAARKGSYSDVYSIGATFYFIVTGKTPTDAAARHLEDLDEPKKNAPNLSSEANKTILKAMEIKPENRYQTVDELMQELTGYKDWRTSLSGGGGGGTRSGISIKMIIGIVIVVLLLLGVGGYIINERVKETERKRKIEVAVNNMLNGNVENLWVWIYGETAFLRPTTVGILDTTAYFNNNGEQLRSLPDKNWISSFSYSGQMQNGFPHGEGFALYSDGSSVFGQWRNSRPDGRVVIINSDGDSIIALFRDGEFARFLEPAPVAKISYAERTWGVPERTQPKPPTPTPTPRPTPVAPPIPGAVRCPGSGLWVAPKVAAGPFNHEDAIRACSDLGAGWRLPNETELGRLYENRSAIGNFRNSGDGWYWSSTTVRLLPLEEGREGIFGINFQSGQRKGLNLGFVRCVRN